jgi:predicted ATP-grasp superfamily ATP-dependent carboligase
LKFIQVVVPRGEHFVALAVVRSLGKKDIKTAVISEDNHAISFHSKYCSSRIISDKSIDDYSAFTEEDLIMPTEEGSMIELVKNRKKYACTLAFPDQRVLEFAFDKKKVIEHATELGIPCPRSYSVESLDAWEQKPGEIPFSAVIKPVRSLGGVGISFADSVGGVKKIHAETMKQFGPVLIQERIPYKERYSVAILMNFSHSMRRCCVLRAIRCHPMNTGPASFVESVDRPDLVKMGEMLLESMQYQGIAEVEFVIDSRDNIPKLMEVNPRFWGSLQGAISSGVDFPALLYGLYQDGDVVKNLEYKRGIKTRNVIPYEYHRLTDIIRGNYPFTFKVSSLIDFLKIYKDDAHFIFSLTDMQPFMSIFTNSIRKRGRKLIKNGT